MLTGRLSVSFLVQILFDEVKEGQTNLAPGVSANDPHSGKISELVRCLHPCCRSRMAAIAPENLPEIISGGV